MGRRTFPEVLGVREQARVMREVLAERLDMILPRAMAEAGIDLWLVLCQEDDLDPVFQTLVPMDSWCPILQILLFHRRGDGSIERINLSMTRTGELYDRPWQGRKDEEQWPILRQLVEERNPARIGINTGSVQWAAGGLTHNLYLQLAETLGSDLSSRLVSAEGLVTRWLAELTDREIALFEQVAAIAHGLLAECFSRDVVRPGVTTADDLEWHYWQRAADLGLGLAFKPFFVIHRAPRRRRRYGDDDRVIRPGDIVRSDVGVRHLGLDSDHQQVAYVRRPGETEPPPGLLQHLRDVHRLQDIYLAEFRHGMTGNQLLQTILDRARREGVPNPRVYSHSLGHLLHEPGPLIGLPWEQQCCPGRGDVPLGWNYAFTMELSAGGPMPEWEDEEFSLSMEEDVVFTREGCRVLDGRQEELYIL